MSDEPLNPYDLSSIDDRMLTPMVESALKRQPVSLMDWTHQRVYGGAGDVGAALSGLYRFAGQARVRDGTIGWSLILKIIGTADSDQDPSDPRFWKREKWAYESGNLVDLPGGLASPRYFGTIEFDEQMVGLWLEDLTDVVGDRWPLAHYRTVARHLGQFNGAYLANETIPAWPWISRGWVRTHVYSSTAAIEELHSSLDRPDLADWFVDGDIERHLQLWDDRDLLLDALDRLPQTFLHRDAFRRNLFARRTEDDGEETVAIDWTYAGIGGVGEELAILIHASLWFSEVEFTDVERLEQLVFDGYLEGLAEAGWHGDSKLARLGYAAASALILDLGYIPLPPGKDLYPWMEQAFGLPIAEFKRLWSQLRHYRLGLADEARLLIDSLLGDTSGL